MVEGEPVSQPEGQSLCPATVVVSHVAALHVGTHAIKIGPAQLDSVALVFEQLDTADE